MQQMQRTSYIVRESGDLPKPYEAQFKYGGVVVLGSGSSKLANSSWWDNGARLELDRVGMSFDSISVHPEPSDGNLYTTACSWNGDPLRLQRR